MVEVRVIVLSLLAALAVGLFVTYAHTPPPQRGPVPPVEGRP
jgi:hypothetical protein